MKFMFGLQHPLTCKPWTTLFNPCNKVRGNYVVKEVLRPSLSCVFLPALSFMHLSLILCRCDAAWTCKWLYNTWRAINRLSIIWRSDLTDKMKRSFFQAAVASILLYGCTTWTLSKRLEKKLDGNYTRMLRAILNKSWRQHPTRHQLYGHLPPITKTIQVRRTRHAGHC